MNDNVITARPAVYRDILTARVMNGIIAVAGVYRHAWAFVWNGIFACPAVYRDRVALIGIINIIIAVAAVYRDVGGVVVNVIVACTAIYRNVRIIVDNVIVAAERVNLHAFKTIGKTITVFFFGECDEFRSAFLVNVERLTFGTDQKNFVFADRDDNIIAADLRRIRTAGYRERIWFVKAPNRIWAVTRLILNQIAGAIETDWVIACARVDCHVRAAVANGIVAVAPVDWDFIAAIGNGIVTLAAVYRNF